MIKKIIKTTLLLTLISFVSCKKADGTTIKLDANNMIVPPEIIQIDPAVEANNIKRIQSYPILEFVEKEFNFGAITDGGKVEHIFKLTNIGKSDLLIINATATCGCTVPTWTKSPIKPGDTGEIKVIFDSTGKLGQQQKFINLVTNTEPGNESISFKAQVNPK